MSLTFMTEEIEKKDAQISDLKSSLAAKDAVLTHIAVAPDMAKVHALIQESGNLDAKELTSVQQLYQEEARKAVQLHSENERLKGDLEQALQKKVSNLEEVRNRMRQEAAAEYSKLLSEQSALHQRELAGMAEKQQRLTKSLESEQENYRNLENSMTEGERQLKKKMNSLEHSLEQLTVLYNQLASQKAILRVEGQVMEKKIKRKQEENLKLLAEVERVRKELIEAKQKEANLAGDPRLRDRLLLRGTFPTRKIKKMIKGGKHLPLRTAMTFQPQLDQAVPQLKPVKDERPFEENALEEERKD